MTLFKSFEMLEKRKKGVFILQFNLLITLFDRLKKKTCLKC